MEDLWRVFAPWFGIEWVYGCSVDEGNEVEAFKQRLIVWIGVGMGIVGEVALWMPFTRMKLRRAS